MASLIRDKKTGRKSIQLNEREGNGSRPKISLGDIPVKDAQHILAKVQAIIAAKRSQRSFDAETADWIAKLEPALSARLVKLGLISPHSLSESAFPQTVIGFIDDYVARRSDVKHGTKLNYAKTRKYLLEYFGMDRRLDTVTLLDAEQFRSWLLQQGLQENTVRSHCKFAKLFFGAAVKGERIKKNPFLGIKTQLVTRTDRMAFVTLEDTQRLLDAAPDADWRCIIALARFGGLRTPSETLAVRWDDINWERGRMLIRSSKTEHHAGKETRWIPLFPELRQVLSDALEVAAERTEFVINRYREVEKNLGTPFRRIIHRAGLTPWPKLFQNLRSSRETELSREHPLHVVVAWMGNSQPVAMKNYLQVQDEDFELGANEPTKKRVQNRVQQGAERGRNGSQAVPLENEKPRNFKEIPGSAVYCNSLRENQLPPVGLERTGGRIRKPALPVQNQVPLIV